MKLEKKSKKKGGKKGKPVRPTQAEGDMVMRGKKKKGCK